MSFDWTSATNYKGGNEDIYGFTDPLVLYSTEVFLFNEIFLLIYLR